MNYEIAKQLKDAGFEHTWCSEDDCSCLTNGVNSTCFPTLSELIKAIGPNITICGHHAGEFNIGGWTVYDNCAVDVKANKWGVYINDEVLENALAFMWLALNKR